MTSFQGRFWLLTTIMCLTAPGVGLAQRADENAVTAAQDAFGTSIGFQTVGLYSANEARGFSPQQAGNLRIEGLYFDQQTWVTGDCMVRETTMRVGIAAQSYSFPAPTGIADLNPSVARHGAPRRPAQHHKRHGCFARRAGGVLRNDARVGVRGIDQGIDAFLGKMIRQTLGAAETANADRHGMRNRRGRAAGKRQRHVKAGARSEPFRQVPGFRRPAEDENFSHAAS